MFFYRIGRFVLYDKNPPGDRTGAVRLDVAEATQPRRRIPQAGFFLVITISGDSKKPDFPVVENQALKLTFMTYPRIELGFPP